MSQPVKFTFERRFGERRANPFSYGDEEQKVALAAHEAALKQAEQAAFAAGREQGMADARAEETARLARAIEVLGSHVDILARDLGDVSEAATAEAIRMAHLFADTLSGALARRLPHARMEEALAAVLRDVRGAPHLVLRVAPDLVEAASARCTALARAHGFEGRLVVLGDPDAMAGDARIEWADGGIAIDREAISRRIGAAVDDLSAAIAPQPIHEDPRMSTDSDLPLPDFDQNQEIVPRMAATDDGPIPLKTAGDLEQMFDVPVNVSAVLGRTRMAVGELMQLGPGRVLELDRKVGEAIDIFVNDRLVARGEVVLVEDKLGVTMTEIIKPER